ncbi:MAG: ribonuclease HIII [Ignavibacteria bacterium]|nr:ribonuclease HIII [Ignavibacteria bacterium]
MIERAKKQLADLIQKVELNHELAKDLFISEIKEGQYNVFVEISRNRDWVKLIIYYGKKGFKLQIQGDKTSKLFKDIDENIFGLNLFPPADEIQEPGSYIGVDESGKGDFFGPLVIGGFVINEKIKSQLINLKIRDSKLLSDSEIRFLAVKIRSQFKENYSTVQINPKRYNELYSKFKNLNQLLAWGHARCIENLLTNNDTTIAICDQFGNESSIKNALLEKGKKIELRQSFRAEKFLGVAAASILARDSFINWIELKSRELKIAIPKGASEIVKTTAKKILEKYGAEKLSGLVKLHFKTSKSLF